MLSVYNADILLGDIIGKSSAHSVKCVVMSMAANYRLFGDAIDLAASTLDFIRIIHVIERERERETERERDREREGQRERGREREREGERKRERERERERERQ